MAVVHIFLVDMIYIPKVGTAHLVHLTTNKWLWSISNKL